MIAWSDDDLRQLTSAADDFARKRLALDAVRHDKHANAEFAVVLKELRTMGYLDLCADLRLGGLGQGLAALAAVLEPVYAVDASAGAAIYTSAAAHLALLESHLPDERIGALTGVQGARLAWPAFHDPAEQSWPVAEPNGKLQGCVEMLLPGTHADWAIFPVRPRADGKLLLVAASLRQPGVSCSKPVRTLGLAACGIADVTFDRAPSVVVSADAMRIFSALAPRLAMAVTAMMAGVMRGSAQVAAAYAVERHQGGGPIIGWGEVRRLLSLMQERLRVSQALLAAACDTGQSDADGGELASYAALHVGALACELTTDGVQLLGGNGYMKDYGQEKRMRDARQLQCLMGSAAWRRQSLVRDG